MFNKQNKLLAGLIAVLVFGSLGSFYKLGQAVSYQSLGWTRPVSDVDWAEDVKKEQLNFKLDSELQEMKLSHEDKLPKIKTLYDKAILYPDVIRYEYMESGMKEPDLTNEVNTTIKQYVRKYEKLQQSIERINKEIDLRARGKVNRTNDILSTKPADLKTLLEINKLKKGL